ncbi:TPA: hypothetical protein ACHVIQ_000337 [Streptococcus suis]|uniref:hypothetical protein n=3 Tax=Streptococcus TaxID=1301 RepID=UPI000CF532A9|nr:hypothetical protein [Streptococcus suis]NQM28019.1 hypothetical protein [Streptococcus suis]HEM4388966.1 hypothetical protein [Streptococcus suis]HEM6027125.1 hypothetical protein [Streptococcus suis]
MTKTEVIEFLTEQRDLRLVGYDDSKPAESDFDRWQLAQAEMFQKVIDWLEGSNVGKLRMYLEISRPVCWHWWVSSWYGTGRT